MTARARAPDRMPGEVNCLLTKVLLPFVERHVGPEAVETICRTASRSRDYLMADHNWIPLALADELMRLGQRLMGEPDLETWSRRFSEFAMDWKPREERSYLGTYTMGIGEPRGIYEKFELFWRQVYRFGEPRLDELGRRHARVRFTPFPGYAMPLWVCRHIQVTQARFPTNWGLPRARIVERQCAAAGAAACVLEISWKNLSLGRPFWMATAAGVAGTVGLGAGLGVDVSVMGALHAATAAMPLVAGVALGTALRERRRRQHTRRLLDLQSEEILFSNNELELKFRDLEEKIEQLSLLIDLGAAVHATLDPERIYERAVERLVHGMGYQAAHLYLVDDVRGVARGHKAAGRAREQVTGAELPLDPEASAVARVATTGRALLIEDVEATPDLVVTVQAAAGPTRDECAGSGTSDGGASPWSAATHVCVT